MESIQQRLDGHHIPVSGRGNGRAPHSTAVADEHVGTARLARLCISRAVAYHHQGRIPIALLQQSAGP